jgi:hypothetical protein
VRLIAILSLCTILAGCRPAGHSVPQAIVGGTLIDGTVRPPIQNAVVLVSRGRVEAVGPSGDVRIPASYHTIDAHGLFVFPAELTEPIRVGADATFLLLNVNPALDSGYLKKVAGHMEGGRWLQYPR